VGAGGRSGIPHPGSSLGQALTPTLLPRNGPRGAKRGRIGPPSAKCDCPGGQPRARAAPCPNALNPAGISRHRKMSDTQIRSTPRPDPSAEADGPGLIAISAAFLRLGCTSLGGGIAGWLHRDIVLRRRWTAMTDFGNCPLSPTGQNTAQKAWPSRKCRTNNQDT